MSGAGLRKRSVNIAGHLTSVSLEQPFWDALAAVAERRGTSVRALVTAIDRGRGAANLSSAIRIFVLDAVSSRVGDGTRTATADSPSPD